MFPTLLAAIALAAPAPDPVPIDNLIRDAMQSWRVPGVAVAIVRPDEVLYLQGHGTRGYGLEEPITPQTLFPLGSCTKGFTTTLLAQLVDEGKLTWDDHVRQHVPTFRLSDPLADADVRLRDLLCHRTGLAGHDPLWYRAPWSRAELIRRVGLVPLDRPFRSAFQYQNTMFVVAGQAAENAAGQPWEKLVRDRLLTPLGMTRTFTQGEGIAAEKLPRGYRPGPDGLQPVPFYLLDKPDPAGSIVSCAADLAKWLQFHLRGGTVDGKPLVKRLTLETTRTPQIALPISDLDRELHPDTTQLSYGMGWVLQDYRGRPLASHAGILDGFRVHFTLAPRDGIGIVILANHERTRMHLALSNALLDHVLGLEKRNWNRLMQEALTRADKRAQEAPRPVRLTGTTPRLPLSSYAGKYEHPAYGTFEIRLAGEKLRWTYNSFAGALEHYHLDTFQLHEFVMQDPLLTFHLDSAAKVERLEILGAFGTTFRRVPE
jgi:CubicO group peptidase (beta-lactamase class C family)